MSFMRDSSKLINDWMTKADHDLGSAKIIYIHIPAYFDTIAFHCQQAVEKYLKALLVHHDIEFQRSHNLIYLLDLLSQKMEISEDSYDKAIMLNEYRVQIRYPHSTIFLNKEELESAINISQYFRDFLVKTLNIIE